MRLGALASLALLLLAGCSGGSVDPETVACPDGSVATLPEGHHHDEGDVAAVDNLHHCPKPKPLSVSLGALGYNTTVYRETSITWSISNGSYTGAHSMFTSVLLSHHPVPTSDLKTKADYGIQELTVKEHQNVPAQLSGTFTLQTPGTFYLRAYAKIYANGVPEGEYFSEEVPIKVLDIATTGKLHTVVHAAGNFQGKLDPATVDMVAGDAFEVDNQDLTEHAFTFQNGPAQGKMGDFSVGMQEKSNSFIIRYPGTYTWTTDDLVQPQTLTVNVALPA